MIACREVLVELATPSRSGLVRGILRADLLALLLNAIIGASIFGLPSQLYRLSGTYSLLAFVVCGIVIAMIGLCFADAGSRFSETGGPYLYASNVFSPMAAFEVGWLVWLARVTGFGTLCNLFVQFLSYFWPGANSGVARLIVIIVIVAAFAGVTWVGIRQSVLVSNLLTAGKVVPILLFIIAGLFLLNRHAFSLAAAPSFGKFSQSVLLLVFTFSGFEYAGILAGEARDPRRDVPFAVLGGIAGAGLLFVLIQVVCIGTLPDLAASHQPLADASRRILGPAGAAAMIFVAMVASAGTLSVQMLAAPRLLFAMAEQKQLPQVFARIHPRFSTPSVSILATAGAMLLFTVMSRFIYALTVGALLRLLTYLATCAAVLVIQRRKQFQSRVRIPFGGLVVWAGLAFCIWLVVSSPWREFRDTLIVATLGLPVYVVQNFLTKRSARTHELHQGRARVA